MADKEREAVITALFEGIIAARNATEHEGNDNFTDCMTFAHAALASLEASGFKVISNAHRT
ncbi:MAG: hypothetical protein KDJ74_13695 [Notoacmeibacter sp.]|nr:hypothetical protein [Notoacmeibacter sp.]